MRCYPNVRNLKPKVWLRYCGTTGKPGGKRRKQTSACSHGRPRSTRLTLNPQCCQMPKKSWRYCLIFKGNFIDANDAALESLEYMKEDIRSLNFLSTTKEYPYLPSVTSLISSGVSIFIFLISLLLRLQSISLTTLILLFPAVLK